ncbi:MAG: hypothetical protein P8Z79_24385, partial [Sedimentisphaerales bacterium]
MPEQERKKRTWAIVWRIGRWIGLSLLTLWLIAAVVLQAPWKSTVLLAVFLFACTVLPRRFRKWFRLGVGCVILAWMIGTVLPEDNEGWRSYTFDGELAALEAKYAVPDKDNAGPIYDEIFETLDTNSNQPEFFLKSKLSSIHEPWLSNDHPEMGQWLKTRQDTIAKLMEASHLEKCHFAIPDHSWEVDKHMERLAPMRQCAFLLVSAGNNDVGEGRKDAGLEKYLCVLRMAGHLYQQPVALDFLVGSGIERLASTHLNRFVIGGEPTAEQLHLIIDALGDLENNWGTEFKGFLESDKLLMKNDFCSMVYEVRSDGRVRFSRDPLSAFRLAQSSLLPTPTYWQRKYCKAKTIFAWLTMPSTPQEVGEIFDTGFDQYNAMTEPGFDWTNRPPTPESFLTKSILFRIRLNCQCLIRFITGFSEEAYFGLHDAYSKMLTLRRSSRLLVATKQYYDEHNVWPPNLDAIKSAVPAEALIDPQNNDSFVYKRTD